MKKCILFLSVITASGLVMITIYNLLVDTAGWGSDMPSSILTARDYYRRVDPRDFFKIIAPINQILILLTIILFWKDSPSSRMYFMAAFVFYAIIASLTFLYFVPRDRIIFNSPVENIQAIKTALTEWKQMNWMRTFLGLAGVLSTCKGLDIFYKMHAAR